MVASRARCRSSGVAGCRVTADMSPTLPKTEGAIQRHVSQSGGS